MSTPTHAPTPTRESAPEVWVVVIHHRAPAWCRESVESLIASEGVRLRIIVVDNSGELPDDLPGVAEGPGVAERRVRIVRPSCNLGFAGGANLGVSEWLAAGGAWCLVTSHDVSVATDTLAHLVAAMEANPRVGVLAPWLTPRVARVGEGATTSGVTRFEWVSGSAMLLRRECAVDIGGFDTDFGSYVEDRELCLRAGRAGWEVGAAPGASASHRGSADPGRAAVMIAGNEILLAAKLGDRRGVLDGYRTLVFTVLDQCAAAVHPRRSTRRALRRMGWALGGLRFATAQLARWVWRGRPRRVGR